MTSKEIRIKFLEFFRSKQHEIVGSAPMVVKNDPTLMFTNAGMNQFKDLFLGNSPVIHPRIADTQKCLRVSGKHNDLEEVGHDTYHHTMFEMLGNWSFGNYFKKEAIAWAWELLTVELGIDPNILYVTVFEGDETEGLPRDMEAYNFWKNHISEDRILLGNKKDNFWEMGDSGPCGPCSEIHADIRSAEAKALIPGQNLVNAGDPLVIEIWNLVFIEFNRMSNGSLVPLPAKHVDTGMGFERLCMVLQHKQSNYDTDVFQPIIRTIAEMAGKTYGASAQDDIAMRVIADHLRAVSFAIADGQLPSNARAGYVIRRILRRAVRYGYSFLGFKEPFIHNLVPVLVNVMGDNFPEIRQQQELVMRVIAEEETSFLRTLSIGIQKFEQYIQTHPAESAIDGGFAFELFDTYGFPVDLTQLMAREKELTVNMEAFNIRLEEQKNRSRSAAAVDTDDWVELIQQTDEPFIGYDFTEHEIHITRYRKVKTKTKEFFQLVFDITPFYGESGGQVGDSGFIYNENEKVIITDTRKENTLTVHFSETLPGDPTKPFIAYVNKEKRKDTARNHTATHLLHKALREVLGSHVEQKGSLVDSERLRFDFSHFQKMTTEEIRMAEIKVNQMIRENHLRDEKRAIPMEEAINAGAMALFGEKYGDKVRMIRFGESIELCGGTHVNSTGEIGFFRIISEGAIAAGIRRIEALTGINAENMSYQQHDLIEAFKENLKSPKDLLKSLQSVIEENSDLRKELAGLKSEKAKGMKTELVARLENINGINFLAAKVPLDTQGIKDLGFEIRNEVEQLLMVLGNEIDGKAGLAVIISDDLVASKKLDASKIIRVLAAEIQGGGGGQPFFATAGGKNPAGLDKALALAKQFTDPTS